MVGGKRGSHLHAPVNRSTGILYISGNNKKDMPS